MKIRSKPGSGDKNKKSKFIDLGEQPEGVTQVVTDPNGQRMLYTSLGGGDWEGRPIELPDISKSFIRKQKRKARFRTRNTFRSTKSNSAGPLEDNIFQRIFNK